jgi:hypothetical protein
MRPESSLDRALRRHRDAVHEERTQIDNDNRLVQGLPPKHCGVQMSLNERSDWACTRCGEV